MLKKILMGFVCISLVALFGCGGGGGGSSQLPATANVSVSIPGNLFDNGNPNVRAAQTVQSLKLRAVAYNNGSQVSGVQTIEKDATLKDGDYVANLDLSKDYDYRFSAFYNDKELLKNHIGIASITSGASFKVDINTSYKTLAYEAWLAKNPTDKSFKNFTAKSAESNLKADSDFASVVNFPYSDFKESLINITSGQTGSLPTTASVDTEKLPATDKPSDNPPDNPSDQPTDSKTAKITGTILAADSSANSVFEVSIYSNVINDTYGMPTITNKKNINANSSFAFENLPVGTYTLVVSSSDTLNIIRNIYLGNGETRTITNGNNNGLKPSEFKATFTPVADANNAQVYSGFSRINLSVDIQDGDDVYYQILSGNGTKTPLSQYDEESKQTLSNNTFNAKNDKNITVSSEDNCIGSVKIFFKLPGGRTIDEITYPLTYYYTDVSMEQTNTGYTLKLSKNISLDLIRCEAGSFLMGSPEDQFGRDFNSYDIERQQKVTLTKPFYLGKFEITRAQYNTIINYISGYVSSSETNENLPARNLAFINALEACDKLNEIFADSIPSGYKFALPSEAQWEYACKAGTTSAFNNGKNILATDTPIGYIDWSTYDDGGLSEIGWYYNNSGNTIHEVGGKSPNNWGFYDMHGNVKEFCRDMFGEELSDMSSADVTDPVGTTDKSYVWLIVRGGGFSSSQTECRSACRRGDQYDFGFPGLGGDDNIGFRVALVPVD